MKVYTYQISQWRRFQHMGIPMIDTTVKSGAIQLAPDWRMVMSWKQGQMSDLEYTHHYKAILEYWWFQDPYYFEWLLQLPVVAFGCYCKANTFCHRYLLVDFISAVADIEYRGELV